MSENLNNYDFFLYFNASILLGFIKSIKRNTLTIFLELDEQKLIIQHVDQNFVSALYLPKNFFETFYIGKNIQPYYALPIRNIASALEIVKKQKQQNNAFLEMFQSKTYGDKIFIRNKINGLIFTSWEINILFEPKNFQNIKSSKFSRAVQIEKKLFFETLKELQKSNSIETSSPTNLVDILFYEKNYIKFITKNDLCKAEKTLTVKNDSNLEKKNIKIEKLEKIYYEEKDKIFFKGSYSFIPFMDICKSLGNDVAYLTLCVPSSFKITNNFPLAMRICFPGGGQETYWFANLSTNL